MKTVLLLLTVVAVALAARSASRNIEGLVDAASGKPIATKSLLTWLHLDGKAHGDEVGAKWVDGHSKGRMAVRGSSAKAAPKVRSDLGFLNGEKFVELGSDGYYQLETGKVSGKAFTAVVVAKPSDALNDERRTLFSLSNADGAFIEVGVQATPDGKGVAVRASSRSSKNSRVKAKSAPVSHNQWSTFAIVQEAGKLQVWVNGQTKASDLGISLDTSALSSLTFDTATVGAQNVDGSVSQHWGGDVAESLVYNEAITGRQLDVTAGAIANRHWINWEAPTGPSLKSVSPPSVRPRGGDLLTISGNNFGQPGEEEDVSVLFMGMMGPTPCDNIKIVNPKTITCNAPMGAGKFVNIRVAVKHVPHVAVRAFGYSGPSLAGTNLPPKVEEL